MESEAENHAETHTQSTNLESSLWTEEKDDEAVWGVFLKKIRYQRQSLSSTLAGRQENFRKYSMTQDSTDSFSPQQQSNGEISHLMWETVRVRVLKAGTLRKIVEATANEDHDIQATHLSVFLATYRAFASPAQVLNEIIYLFRHSTSDLVQKTMLDCLNVWLDSYSEDFESGGDGYECLRKVILPFAQEENLPQLTLKVQYKLRARRRMKKSLSVQSLNSSSPVSHIKTYSLLSLPSPHFAQQLTYSDKELFLKLRVWECLGGLWKRRCGCASVVATVEEFNKLSGRVVGSILSDSAPSFQQRAKILDKWIKIAQELRSLKNFSSLKAIISALESSPIFRLSKLWSLLPKDLLTSFSQLSAIFSEENNRAAQRTLLEIEGTSKTSSTASPAKSPRSHNFIHRVLLRGSGGDGVGGGGGGAHGTIPYLGTFLTDLIFIDAAYPDLVHGTLINFEKRKKEFEILAQLKLLQGSAKSYRLEEDPYFTSWYNSLSVLDDKRAYEISLQIQPERSPAKGHKKNDSFASNSSSETTNNSPVLRKGSIPSSNESSLLYSSPLLNSSDILMPNSPISTNGPPPDSSSLVVKISSPVKGDVMYKSMIVGNSDHTPQVICQALDKLGLESEDSRRFHLVQVLASGRELKFPPNANVFYAIDSGGGHGEIRLELRPKVGSSNLKSTSSLHSHSMSSLHNNNNYKVGLNSSFYKV